MPVLERRGCEWLLVALVTLSNWSSWGMVAAAAAAPPSGPLPYLRMKDLPGVSAEYASSKEHWIPLDQDSAFLPSEEMLEQQLLRRLEQDEGDASGQWDGYNPYSVQPFVEGMGDYDEYQQAWRMLGFMIDCNAVAYGDDQADGHSGSNDEDVTEDGCARYILWAAYVDLNYEGDGIAEYQYFNTSSASWDKSACQYADSGNSRCAKMDCHLSDTNWSLLGFFKHRSYDDWMEQLFKHEGMCVWTEQEYAFMKNARKAWPQGCTNSGTTLEGKTIYYDIKPKYGGRIGVGLYTDSRCVEEYTDDVETIENMIGNFFVNNGGGSHDSGDNNNYDFSGDSLKQSMQRWNSAFDVWTVCHPCVAHDVRNTDGTLYYNSYYGNGNDDYYNRDRRDLGGEYGPQGDKFECYDDAGYTNVNQCMKFSAKTVMRTATFRDMSLARAQNALASKPLAGFMRTEGQYMSQWVDNVMTYITLALASICFCTSCVFLYRAKTSTDYDFSNVKVDLLPNANAQAA